MFTFPKRYDVIVIGSGHAGVEAALAAARMGCQTLLLTINADTIGQMSCNPAIGGLAKGHLAREIDALGGEMGINTDLTGIQFRMLNTKKGPSVWAPRAQCDKKAYQFRLKWVCEREPNLDIKQGQGVRILHHEHTACGVETNMGIRFEGSAVVVTTGTFLRGLMHIGQDKQSGGRSGEAAATGLSASLVELGIELGRLKTGTPPRLLRRSIDFSRTEIQPGDEPIPYFSHWTKLLENSANPDTNQRTRFPSGLQPRPQDAWFQTPRFPGMFHVEQDGTPKPDRRYPEGSILSQIGCQLPCYLTTTSPKTEEIIRKNLHLSPMYSGEIKGIGPRYCPSIEDKFVKFPEKEKHQVFLEPEGIGTDEIYLNGCSTSLPFQVQVELVNSIVGCEKAEIFRPAYAVEYDFAYPTQLKPSLETKACANLYLAGQINGTSGYEEAGAQGLIAGINAARRVKGLEPIVLGRNQAYIGVLIDDLVTKGTTEPYRMFTSRAEYRLLLRQDNADLRLSQIGYDIGLLCKSRYESFVQKRQAIHDELERLNVMRDGHQTLTQILRRPEVTYSQLPHKRSDLTTEVIEQVEIAVKYQGYVERQEFEVMRNQTFESKVIPPEIDYAEVPSLRKEARQKLTQIRPTTVGQAARISGVSPSDISILLIWLRRGQNIPK